MRRHTPKPVIGTRVRGPVEFPRQENAGLQVLDDCMSFSQLLVPEGEPPFRRARHRRRIAAPLLGQD
jgi:hypothetical protein